METCYVETIHYASLALLGGVLWRVIDYCFSVTFWVQAAQDAFKMNYEQLVAGVTGLVRWCAVWQPQAVAGAFLLSLMPGSRLACGCHCTLFAAFLLLQVPDSEEHSCTWSATCVTQHM